MYLRYLLALITILAASLSAQTVIAVTKLSSSGLQEQETQSLTDALRSELGKRPQFQVMERAMMEEILKEQGFQQSGACSEASCAITIGQLLAVNYMVLGSIGKVGKTYTLNVRLVDVGSGSIVKDVTEYHKGKVDALLTGVIHTVVDELSTFGSNEPSLRKVKIRRKNPALIISLVGIGAAAAVAVPVYLLTREDKSSEEKTGKKDLTLRW